MTAGLVIWPYPIRLTAERIPEEDRGAYEARRFVREFPVRRVIAQSRLLCTAWTRIAVGLVTAEPTTVSVVYVEAEPCGLLETQVFASIDRQNRHRLALGQVLRLAPDRKYPHDPAQEALDLLATLITGTGAGPVADRMLATLDSPDLPFDEDAAA